MSRTSGRYQGYGGFVLHIRHHADDGLKIMLKNDLLGAKPETGLKLSGIFCQDANFSN